MKNSTEDIYVNHKTFCHKKKSKGSFAPQQQEQQEQQELEKQTIPYVRLCHIKKWKECKCFGFNLQSKRDDLCHYIGRVEPGSPAQMAGLRAGDKIVEINKISIEKFNYDKIIELIEKGFKLHNQTQTCRDEVLLLVVDKETLDYYNEANVSINSENRHLPILFNSSNLFRRTKDLLNYIKQSQNKANNNKNDSENNSGDETVEDRNCDDSIDYIRTSDLITLDDQFAEEKLKPQPQEFQQSKQSPQMQQTKLVQEIKKKKNIKKHTEQKHTEQEIEQLKVPFLIKRLKRVGLEQQQLQQQQQQQQQQQKILKIQKQKQNEEAEEEKEEEEQQQKQQLELEQSDKLRKRQVKQSKQPEQFDQLPQKNQQIQNEFKMQHIEIKPQSQQNQHQIKQQETQHLNREYSNRIINNSKGHEYLKENLEVDLDDENDETVDAVNFTDEEDEEESNQQDYIISRMESITDYINTPFNNSSGNKNKNIEETKMRILSDIKTQVETASSNREIEEINPTNYLIDSSSHSLNLTDLKFDLMTSL
jgi:hypothetical protein